MMSVIVPASNESAVIGGTLAALLDDAQPEELEVIVVCNGCTDDTSQIAAGFGPAVRVVETPCRSKSKALNLGDQVAQSFPRFYVDADIRLHTSDIRTIAEALSASRAVVASPALELDASTSSWSVRAYHRIWVRLPAIRAGLVGRGVYCMTQEGRDRFGAFPDVIADDLFMHVVFEPASRLSVTSCSSEVRAPQTLKALLERKTRACAGNRQLQTIAGNVAGGDTTAWLRVVAEDRRLAWDVPVYVFVTLVAMLRGRWKLLRGEVGTWNRDESTRSADDSRVGQAPDANL